ncbi:hypothetical protein [Rhizobium sp. YK2]|uniref:hypothetical protein n=1 Tax=Rhizobium sp. YK2 TaxID=1860096 RepID=UPI00114CA0BB|nr:hypothetical protein [Rhizobium sp. YK2]
MKIIAAVTFVVGSLFFVGEAYSETVGDLVGTWNHDNSGENIQIKRDNDVFDSQLGQGRISTTIDHAANFVIAYQGGKYCWYYITTTNRGKRMNLAVRNPSQSPKTCLSGTFNKAD